MNLNKLVLDKIEELGIDGSAEYFGKSVGTIRSWKNKKSATIEAAEKVLADAADAQDSVTTSGYADSKITTTEAMPEWVNSEAEPPGMANLMERPRPALDYAKLSEDIDNIWIALKDINGRTVSIEGFIRRANGLPPMSDVDPIHSRVVPPKTAPPPAIQQITPPVVTPTVNLPTESDGINLIKPGDWLSRHDFGRQRI